MVEPPEPSKRKIFLLRSVGVVCCVPFIVGLHVVPEGSSSGLLSFELIISWCFSFAGVLMFMYAQNLVQERRDNYALLLFNAARSGDVETFAVFLRPFYLTGKMMQWRFQFYSKDWGKFDDLEQAIVSTLDESMPTVALGKPGETSGFGRISMDESSWESAAAELMLRASLIICIPSAHPGTAWELEEIMQKGYLVKTVFVMPPSGGFLRCFENSFRRSLKEDWNLAAELLRQHQLSLPNYKGRGMFFAFKRGGQCIKEDLDLGSSDTISAAITRMMRDTAYV